MEYITKSTEETKKLGREIADQLIQNIGEKSHNVIALVGELGAGKTTFVQGFSEGLGIESRIISPTFILMRTYELVNSKIKHKNEKFKNLYHVDLYRFEENVENEMINLGLKDLIGDPANIVVVEWADKAREFFPDDTVWINFKAENDIRRIEVNGLN